MALIDEIQFHAKAGKGGDGVARWRHEKFKEFAGAAGGNGGRGGDVYARAVRDINILARHKTTKLFSALNGDDGQNLSKQGKTGEDCYIDLPIGSVITNTQSGRVVELVDENQISKILHGGRGGLGNEYFKASTNVSPEQSTLGVQGEEADFNVELDLIADAGLVGLPNAGKSSLLNAVTSAHAKVGSYQFTTLDPNLGALSGGYILADLPGLIEGAAEGRGLGHKFLKHVKRTKILLHLVALGDEVMGNNSDGGKIVPCALPVEKLEETYLSIRKELEKYGNGLPEKEEILILTKTDLVDEKALQEARRVLSKYNENVLDVTVLDDGSIKKLSDEITKKLETKIMENERK